MMLGLVMLSLLVANSAVRAEVIIPDGRTLISSHTGLLTEVGDGVFEEEQTNAAYVCASTPRTSGYVQLEQYLATNAPELILYPIRETFDETNALIDVCSYLPRKYHCYPPDPVAGLAQLYFTYEHDSRTFYSKVFWGQASDARVQSILTVTKAAIPAGFKKDVYRVTSYPNHMHHLEIVKEPEAGSSAVKPCPADGRIENAMYMDTDLGCLFYTGNWESYDTGKNVCSVNGGSLLTVADQAQFDMLPAIMTEYNIYNLWISLVIGDDGEWHWLDDNIEPLEGGNWAVDSPGEGDTVAFLVKENSQTKIATAKADEDNGFLCQL